MANRKKRPTKAQWALLGELVRVPHGMTISSKGLWDSAHKLEALGYAKKIEDRYACPHFVATEEGKAAYKERRERNGKA